MASSLSLHLLVFLLPHLLTMAAVMGGWKDIPFAPPMPSFIPNLPDPTSFLTSEGDGLLLFNYYDDSCPKAESIISNGLKQWLLKDSTLAPSLIKLHYFDCMSRGCDASILLNHEDSERRAPQAKHLRGFDVIDDIKADLEKECPKTVSCADILASVAREATVRVGGPYWPVAYGRKDGLVSKAEDLSVIPRGYENVTYLIEFFQSRGLNLIDLVVLSGAHTVGRASCATVQNRIFNYKGTGKPDPTINPEYLDFLKRKCRWASEYVDLDTTRPRVFDNSYFVNLQDNMGLLPTDQKLNADSRTLPLVSILATNNWLFSQQFAVSMVNLGDTQVLTGDDEGEIHANCNYVNN